MSTIELTEPETPTPTELAPPPMTPKQAASAARDEFLKSNQALADFWKAKEKFFTELLARIEWARTNDGNLAWELRQEFKFYQSPDYKNSFPWRHKEQLALEEIFLPAKKAFLEAVTAYRDQLAELNRETWSAWEKKTRDNLIAAFNGHVDAAESVFANCDNAFFHRNRKLYAFCFRDPLDSLDALLAMEREVLEAAKVYAL